MTIESKRSGEHKALGNEMRKTDGAGSEDGKLDDYGGRPSSGQWHKGSYVMESTASTKGKGWHGFGKPVKLSSYKER
jgi:hypothetical protein